MTGEDVRPVSLLPAWLSGYQRGWLPNDLRAGVSVAAVAVPVAIAYAQLAGMPPVHGLYASLLPLLAYALLGTSRQLIIAPDAATCALVAATVAPMAGADPARYLSLTAALAMIAGIFCVAAGFLRLGFLTNFLARPILTGYLNGIAISIIAGQLGSLFGFAVPSSGFFRLIAHFVSNLGQTHFPTLMVGGATLALLLLLARLLPRLPGPLVAVVLGIVGSMLLGPGGLGIRLLGAIPAGLPSFALPNVDAADWQPLALGAVGLALISYNSAMVTARGFAAKNRYEIEPNREFIALGVANIGAGALQGFAVSGADSRTAVNDAAGGKSQVTGLVAGAVLALTLMFATGPLAGLPMAVLSAILVKSAMGLFDWKGLLELRRVSPMEFRLCLVTLLGVITVGVLPGVVVAIALAIVQLMILASRPHDATLGRLPGTDIFRDVRNAPEAETTSGLVIYRFEAALVFFNADHFKSRIRTLLLESPAPVHHLLIDAEAINYIDTTGAACLDQLRDELGASGVRMAVAAARSPVRMMLDRTGLTERIGTGHIFGTVAEAVRKLSGL